MKQKRIGTALAAVAACMLLPGAVASAQTATATATPTTTATTTAAPSGQLAADLSVVQHAAVLAWNARDVEAFLFLFTDRGLMENFEVTRAEARAELPQFITELHGQFQHRASRP